MIINNNNSISKKFVGTVFTIVFIFLHQTVCKVLAYLPIAGIDYS